jgi:hypothetical protein
MGSMSASDAAPLPRLGEVFFDVRGESRTMRLSWYADTGVAVFSIWQGGTCTGTFRLPITDLPRMVEALQRGPHGRDEGITGEQPASREPRPPAAPASPGQPGPARASRPELLDRDIETGQTTAAIYSPPSGPAPAGYQAAPDLTGYQAAPDPAGYQAGPDPAGYQAAPDPAGYQAAPDPAGYQAGPPPPGRRGKPSRRQEPPPGPEFADEAAHADGSADLAGDPGEYAAGPLPPDFTGEYPAGPPTAKFPDEYAAEAPPPEFPGERGSRRRGREAGEARRREPGEARRREPGEARGRYPGEPPAPDLPDGPSRGYSGGHSRRSSGRYQAPPAASYPEPSQGYLDEPATVRYPGGPADGYLDEEPVTPGYPPDYAGGPPGAEPGGDPTAAGRPGGYGRESRGGRYPASQPGPGGLAVGAAAAGPRARPAATTPTARRAVTRTARTTGATRTGRRPPSTAHPRGPMWPTCMTPARPSATNRPNGASRAAAGGPGLLPILSPMGRHPLVVNRGNGEATRGGIDLYVNPCPGRGRRPVAMDTGRSAGPYGSSPFRLII